MFWTKSCTQTAYQVAKCTSPHQRKAISSNASHIFVKTDLVHSILNQARIAAERETEVLQLEAKALSGRVSALLRRGLDTAAADLAIDSLNRPFDGSDITRQHSEKRHTNEVLEEFNLIMRAKWDGG